MAAEAQPAPVEIRREDYRPPDWTITSVDLDFQIGDSHVDVCSRLQLQRQAVDDVRLVLNGRQQQLVEVRVNAQALEASAYELGDETLIINNLPASCELTIHTRIDPGSNTSLEGLYAAGDMLCTQCEAHGFSRISYFLDRPDVLATYRVSITADSQRYPVLLSNGNRVSQVELDDGRHSVVWEDPFPKPCYLFALVAGDLARVSDSYRTQDGRDIAIDFYVEHGKEGLCDHAVNALKQAMAWDEATYGLAYDLDLYMVVAVSSFNMGAMENKGLNVFNDRFVLVSPETATDTDYELVTAIIGHEYFHNWTGNRVTCRDWFQLSLKEGLTVFREQQFMEDTVGGSTQRIEQVRMLRERQFSEDAGPLSHPVRPDSYIEMNNFYTATVYEKGAELVRMQQRMLGQARFADGLRQYLSTHDGQAATIEDFVAAMQAQTDEDLGQFMHWYAQAGTPALRIDSDYDSQARTFKLSILQETATTPGQDDKRPMHIPLAIGLLDAGGQSLGRVESEIHTLREAQSVIRFDDVETEPTPVFLQGFSAPVTLEYPYTAGQLSLIALNTTDGYACWQAMQSLYQLHLLGDDCQDVITQTCHELLGEDSDPALLAELLTLPSENQLLDAATAPVALDALLARRDSLMATMAEALADALIQIQGESVPTEYSPENAARRRLSAVALNLLLQSPNPEKEALAASRFRAVENMSESLAALQALRDVDCASRDDCLQVFRQRWDGNALVLDKWFALQAMTRFGDAAARVRRLMNDAGFELRNPNRVRALIGAFAMQNPRGLHASDGSGYDLLAEYLPQLDALNPQVSARMAQALSNWRRMDTDRQQRIASLLDDFLKGEKLSADFYEILMKLRSAPV